MHIEPTTLSVPNHPINLMSDTLKNDRELILRAVLTRGPLLEDAKKKFRADPEIVRAAARDNFYLAEDWEISDGESVENAIRFISPKLKKDKSVFLTAIKAEAEDPNGYHSNISLKYADDSLKADKAFMLKALKIDGSLLSYADKTLKEDFDIALTAVTSNGLALADVPAPLSKNRQIVLAAVKQDGNAINVVDESLRTDREIVLAAVSAKSKSSQRENEALKHISQTFKQDKQIVLAAVRANSWSLAYADDSFKKDMEVALASSSRIKCITVLFDGC